MVTYFFSIQFSYLRSMIRYRRYIELGLLIAHELDALTHLDWVIPPSFHVGFGSYACTLVAHFA